MTAIQESSSVTLPTRYTRPTWYDAGFDDWGYIDKDGRWIIEPDYDAAFPFSDGLAAVCTDSEMDKDGIWIAGPEHFIDKRGEKISDSFKEVLPFTEGLAAVCVSGKWGFIDTLGKMVIPPHFDRARQFIDGLAAVAHDGKWGFIKKFHCGPGT